MVKPLFSIAIPAFNSINYIKETVRSVLNQTFKDFELVIVDDCSNDGTWDFIQTIKDTRVKVFRNLSNLGIVKNWGKCIERANGIWFKFLMHDDVMFPDSLYILNGLIKKYPNNFVIVSSGIDFNNSKTVEKYLGIENRVIKNTDKYLILMKEIISRRKRFNQTWAMPNSYTLLTRDMKELIKRKDYKKVEVNLGKTGHCVDYFILYAIATRYKTMIEMDIHLYGVRYHEANFSKTYNQNLLYHLSGDKYIHYMLYDYSGIENLYIIRHAFRIYVKKVFSNKKKIISFSTVTKTVQLLIFLFKHIFGIQLKLKN